MQFPRMRYTKLGPLLHAFRFQNLILSASYLDDRDSGSIVMRAEQGVSL